MAASRLLDRVGQVLGGRYRLLAPIGTGASASVYVADDVVLRRRVAVKVLHAALADDEAFLRRFRAEAQAAAALNHPHIVAVYDWGQDVEADGGAAVGAGGGAGSRAGVGGLGQLEGALGTPFLVTELLAGGSLRSLLDVHRRLTPAQTLLVGLETARGLEYAHRRGFVHRDIKPANLLFGDGGRLRIADFGLARALAEAAWTEPVGAVLGTARYASPEQARGESLDFRSDVYSLALVMIEAATGRLPFAADTTIGTLMARVHQPLPVPDELGALADPLRWAGERDPRRRPDAAEFGAALLAAATAYDRPTRLPLVGLPERGQTIVPGMDPTEPVPTVDGEEAGGGDVGGGARGPAGGPTGGSSFSAAGTAAGIAAGMAAATVAGVAGVAGAAGASGVAGVAGAAGASGVAGVAGAAGAVGSAVAGAGAAAPGIVPRGAPGDVDGPEVEPGDAEGAGSDPDGGAPRRRRGLLRRALPLTADDTAPTPDAGPGAESDEAAASGPDATLGSMRAMGDLRASGATVGGAAAVLGAVPGGALGAVAEGGSGPLIDLSEGAPDDAVIDLVQPFDADDDPAVGSWDDAVGDDELGATDAADAGSATPEPRSRPRLSRGIAAWIGLGEVGEVGEVGEAEEVDEAGERGAAVEHGDDRATGRSAEAAPSFVGHDERPSRRRGADGDAGEASVGLAGVAGAAAAVGVAGAAATSVARSAAAGAGRPPVADGTAIVGRSSGAAGAGERGAAGVGRADPGSTSSAGPSPWSGRATDAATIESAAPTASPDRIATPDRPPVGPVAVGGPVPGHADDTGVMVLPGSGVDPGGPGVPGGRGATRAGGPGDVGDRRVPAVEAMDDRGWEDLAAGDPDEWFDDDPGSRGVAVGSVTDEWAEGAATDEVAGVGRGRRGRRARRRDERAVAARDPRPPRRRRRRRRRSLVVLAVLLVVAVLASAGTAYWWYEVRVPTYAVPAVVGKSVAEMTAETSSFGWSVDRTDQFDERAPSGQILTQDPAPGIELARGGTFAVTVSKGPPPVDVPALVGQPLESATSTLARSGLGLGPVERVYDEQAASGTVLRLADGTPASLPKGSDVAVVVSKGPEPRTIPDGLVGGPVEAANTTLRNLGLQTEVTQEFSDAIAKGNVIRIDPGVGAQAEKGSTVRITASKGPPTVDVPSVEGKSVEEAAATLEAAGLTVSGTKGSPTKPVTGTDPAAGTTVRRGTSVEIVTATDG